MNYYHKKNEKNKFFKRTFCSLYEVENFLHGYYNLADAFRISKIIKRHQPKWYNK